MRILLFIAAILIPIWIIWVVVVTSGKTLEASELEGYPGKQEQ
jgi:hypothetical protein